MEITQLGNASPGRVVLAQRLGALDLDLRGAWRGDAEIRIETTLTAGGTIWLPRDVRIEGVYTGAYLADTEAEVDPPTLRLELPERRRNLLLIR